MYTYVMYIQYVCRANLGLSDVLCVVVVVVLNSASTGRWSIAMNSQVVHYSLSAHIHTYIQRRGNECLIYYVRT